ncbi:MAG: hypothetical protein PHG00_10085 [Methylococcales bacterium]|nr:hypothetical protein [Methylococcales bacterium]
MTNTPERSEFLQAIYESEFLLKIYRRALEEIATIIAERGGQA